jgi:hypothetical protein
MSSTCSEFEGELGDCRVKGSYCEEDEKIEVNHSVKSWRREDERKESKRPVLMRLSVV